jgi:hypothetical protein
VFDENKRNRHQSHNERLRKEQAMIQEELKRHALEAQIPIAETKCVGASDRGACSCVRIGVVEVQEPYEKADRKRA